ncbi:MULTISPECIES: radical SAM family heme chaperone HemW [Bacillus]|uniref:Heme chaperone HemW n=2 Tax=Bacillus TaxID=1386 RepID=A0A0M3R9M2_9BACI|nr:MULTISPECIES: radical SAM family heme chaperone HemW [Bacillus]ALC81682.1 coproporphyrinogen III oxidase [Bacillus gobiensis]MBP1080732.1 oxygen-independent coproporphyrinogen-3 oxidase [Bacillus capparidis]MED1094588.1 radical SAM family heme chaperone HemW [Bacillus capparidis]
MKSAYIHIPFCEHICHYCDFNKFFIQNQPVDDYLVSLEAEMKNTIEREGKSRVDTIFIGGGTPTSLSVRQLEHLMNSIHKVLEPSGQIIEFSVEANPDDLNAEKLSFLKEAGVNRLSLGVQTFEDELLKKIGRVHETKDVFIAVEQARKAGFQNISLDLMFGLPGQTTLHLERSLQTALSLDAEHYSVYSLIVEPKTIFYNLMQKGRLHLPAQETEAEMYELVMENMDHHGVKQYEISNFSKPGFESRHNLTYWNNEHYYGFGAGAHGYVNGKRTVNAGPLKKYMALVDEKGFPYTEESDVSFKEKIEEEMFLGLRKTAGVNKHVFQEKFGQPVEAFFAETVQKLEKQGLLLNGTTNISLTHKGKLLGNEVFQSFLK